MELKCLVSPPTSNYRDWVKVAFIVKLRGSKRRRRATVGWVPVFEIKWCKKKKDKTSWRTYPIDDTRYFFWVSLGFANHLQRNCSAISPRADGREPCLRGPQLNWKNICEWLSSQMIRCSATLTYNARCPLFLCMSPPPSSFRAESRRVRRWILNQTVCSHQFWRNGGSELSAFYP